MDTNTKIRLILCLVLLALNLGLIFFLLYLKIQAGPSFPTFILKFFHGHIHTWTPWFARSEGVGVFKEFYRTDRCEACGDHRDVRIQEEECLRMWKAAEDSKQSRDLVPVNVKLPNYLTVPWSVEVKLGGKTAILADLSSGAKWSSDKMNQKTAAWLLYHVAGAFNAGPLQPQSNSQFHLEIHYS